MRKEGLLETQLIIKPNVFRTKYKYYTKKKNLIKYITRDYIQLGGTFLTGNRGPARIYYVERVAGEDKLYTISRPHNLMLATNVASAILEEIAHATNKRKDVYTSAHGQEFYREFIRLWKRYFHTLQFQLIGIYGTEGDY